MNMPPQGPQQPNQPGGQPPPPPGYGPPSQGGAQPPPPPGYGPPQGQYGQPQGQPAAPQGAGPAQEWGYPSNPPKKSRGKTWIALGVAGAFALALCGGGGLFAYSKLGGGGPQHEGAAQGVADEDGQRRTVGVVLDDGPDELVELREGRLAGQQRRRRTRSGQVDRDRPAPARP